MTGPAVETVELPLQTRAGSIRSQVGRRRGPHRRADLDDWRHGQPGRDWFGDSGTSS